MKNLKILVVVIIFFLISVFLKSTAKELPKLGLFPAFNLISQDGNTYNEKYFIGKKVIFSFFFTSCKGPCPTLNSNLVRIQKDLTENKDLLFVSVTIDPKRDSPDILREYAKKIGANLENWVFLTGSIDEIVKLSEGDLKLGVDPAEYNHSTKVILVDKESNIRGLFDSDGKKEIKELERTIKSL